MASSSKDSIYTLNNEASGVTEQKRLNAQQGVFLKLTGGYFPPVIQSYIKELEAPRVADIATGTGVWLTSLAQQLPKAAQLHGYDFDTSKFPTADMLPSNVKLGFGNVLEPFPRDVHGNYDLVHVRLLAFGMKKGDWLPAIRHVKDLLKPGGWLFWEETGEGSWGVMPPSKAFTELLEVEVGFAVEVAGRDLLSPFNLRSHFQSAGLLDSDERIHNSLALPENISRGGKTLLPIITQAVHGMVAKAGYGHIRSQEDAAELLGRVRKDMVDGERYDSWNLHWLWGRKGDR